MKMNISLPTVVFSLLILLLVSVPSCTYKERVQPINLPTGSQHSIVISSVWVSADAYVDQKAAKEAFGFDIRGAGLLPVQVVFQNDGDRTVSLVPEQTFLIDSRNQAWPVNTLERTYQRVEKHVGVGETVARAGKPAFLMGAAGAIAGLAVGIVTGENIGQAMGKGAALGAAAGAIAGGASGYQDAKGEIKQDLSGKSLVNKPILPNQIGYGMLFFPGFKEEAQDATQLRLTLSFGGVMESVTLFLAPAP
ncbi:MAG: hypothetical protein V1706_01880 [Pseudomonadota bacterium]